MKKILKYLALLLGVAVVAVVGLMSYVSIALPDVPEPEDLKIEYTQERIMLGKYLG